MSSDWIYGLLNLSFWSYVAISVVTAAITVLAVTLYLHRDATHRSIDLHPALRHFSRFWIWFTSSMLTREWVAVHRKHHAFADRPGDPHSPRVEGLRRILLEGTEYYHSAARDEQVQSKYGKGTPDDWIERNVYSRHRSAGIVAFVLLELVLFGIPGIIMIGVQMLTMPVLAAGFINGFGHSIGYRSYEVENSSTNIVPWGVLAGGEELHNNHHAFPTSAKFSVQPWEFDLGWLCIVVLRSVGLVKVRRVVPVFSFAPLGVSTQDQSTSQKCDYAEVLVLLIRNKMHLLREYGRRVVVPIVKAELRHSCERRAARLYQVLLLRKTSVLDSAAHVRLQNVLAMHPALKTVHEFQEDLRRLCDGSYRSNAESIESLKRWCARAQSSGIEALDRFAASLAARALPQLRN